MSKYLHSIRKQLRHSYTHSYQKKNKSLDQINEEQKIFDLFQLSMAPVCFSGKDGIAYPGQTNCTNY